MVEPLEAFEGIKYQSTDESLAYRITTTGWVSDPTSPSVKAYNEHPYEDVTSTVFPSNSPSVSGDVITLSLLTSLTKGRTYRIEVQFTVGSNIWECYFRVKCIL